MLTDMGVLVVMSAFLPVLLSPPLAAAGGSATMILWAAIVFVSVELGYELGSRAMPLERQAFHWVMSAPISAASLLVARALSLWWIGMPCVAVVAAVGGLGLGLGVGSSAQVAVLGGLLLGISIPVGLAAGVYLGRPDWRHPRQMLTLGGRMVLLALLLALAGGFWITLEVKGWSQAPGTSLIPMDIATWGWVLVAGALATLLCSWAAWRRLRSLEWLH
jgi:hypothetical protein